MTETPSDREQDIEKPTAPVSSVMSDDQAKPVIAIPGSEDTLDLPGKLFQLEKPLELDSGLELTPVEIAYQTYGQLNERRNNAILICHALTGDQFVAETHPITGKKGWWDLMVGPGRPIDTDRYFVICSNILSGCMGSSGPASRKPESDQPYGQEFPVVTINDMVKAQKALVEHFGIEKLFAVVGGSMGGMQALQWAVSYPDMMEAVVPIATAPRHTAQNIAFHEIGRQAIMADPDWCQGNYHREGKTPRAGLSVARMTAHVTYLSEAALHRKFGRRLQDRKSLTYGFDADFQVESYLRYQGFTFVDRFDANTYLYITRAMDYFDLAAEHDGRLANAFMNSRARFCVVSFSSDWLFPTSESKSLVHALSATGADVSFVDIESDAGHDAFLLDVPEFREAIQGFLDSCWAKTNA
ncbi:homoserine O-acetyltransferase MetX [Kiloniella sp. b19]|uniref:homoserine O-acetyltransferase MetX n=1 Tax=Kiloniella sp. GXU_MW_B19 TaxID=3141326 RepID=UPI0031D1E9FE